ncbi:MAG TPA: hypothetical protein VGT08_12865 [Terracidiphilus sp.]|nr:hypothetical protein [Terracidiphilus sp.]
MKIRIGWRIWHVVLAAAWALAVLVQVAGGAQTSAQTRQSSLASVQTEQSVASIVFREIYDPNSGDHWLLIHDPIRPGGPGRMVLASIASVKAGQPGPDGAIPAGLRQVNRAQPLPVIHSGDRVIAEENTARVNARLEAVALGPAVSGSPLNVRLTIGSNVVRAVALGPGRVSFAPETAVLP